MNAKLIVLALVLSFAVIGATATPVAAGGPEPDPDDCEVQWRQVPLPGPTRDAHVPVIVCMYG